MPARPAGRRRRPWNKGLLIGQKKLLEPKHVWSIRVRLEIAQAERDLAIFNLAIDSIPAALKRFLATRPKMRVFFDIRRFESVIDSVDSGVAELGLVIGLGDHRGLDSEVFFSEPMVCVMQSDHPLAAQG
jgi:DNA-binding transcriptional LysR family regulator